VQAGFRRVASRRAEPQPSLSQAQRRHARSDESHVSDNSHDSDKRVNSDDRSYSDNSDKQPLQRRQAPPSDPV